MFKTIRDQSMHCKNSEPDLWSLIGILNSWHHQWVEMSSLLNAQASERSHDDQSHHEDQVEEEEELSDLKDADVFRT